MPSSLKFVIGVLLLAALCVPASLAIQRHEMQSQARTLAAAATSGNPEIGEATGRRLGCGACHQVGAAAGTSGKVGPALKDLSARAEIAGKTANEPQSLIAWIQHPQAISPGVGMPDIRMSDQDARDIAAYLYTLRGS